MKNWKLFVVVISLGALSACVQSPKGLTANDFSQSAYQKMPVEASSILADAASASRLNVLDVRTPEEFKAGCLDHAKNIDFEGVDFASQIAGLDKNADYFVYCRSGRRSALAVAKMREAGFKNIIELRGGFAAWVDSGEPVSTECK